MGESAALKERKNMNCRIAEGMVNKYIDHTLPLNDLEDFLEHIEKCSSCYDELATYSLYIRPCSSWMRNRKILFWILRSFWKRISENPEGISEKRNFTERSLQWQSAF